MLRKLSSPPSEWDVVESEAIEDDEDEWDDGDVRYKEDEGDDESRWTTDDDDDDDEEEDQPSEEDEEEDEEVEEEANAPPTHYSLDSRNGTPLLSCLSTIHSHRRLVVCVNSDVEIPFDEEQTYFDEGKVAHWQTLLLSILLSKECLHLEDCRGSQTLINEKGLDDSALLGGSLRVLALRLFAPPAFHSGDLKYEEDYPWYPIRELMLSLESGRFDYPKKLAESFTLSWAQIVPACDPLFLSSSLPNPSSGEISNLLHHESYHRLLAHRLRAAVGAHFLSFCSSSPPPPKLDPRLVYAANRLVFWRLPVDALVHSLLPPLLSCPGSLVGPRKALAKALLGWHWPPGYASVRACALAAMESLASDASEAYNTAKNEGREGRLLTGGGGGGEGRLVEYLDEREGQGVKVSQLRVWDVFLDASHGGFSHSAIEAVTGVLPGDWDVENYLRRNSIFDDPINQRSTIDFKTYYRSLLHLVALKTNPLFQRDLGRLYHETLLSSSSSSSSCTFTTTTPLPPPPPSNSNNPHEADEAEEGGFMPAPVKSLSRAADKSLEYRGEAPWPPVSPPSPTPGWKQAVACGECSHFVVDWVRCGMVAKDCAEAVLLIRKVAEKFRVLRVKNTMGDEESSSFGYRSIILNIEYQNPEVPAIKMVCEVQIILKSFFAIRQQMHLYYKILRAESAWNMANDFLGIKIG